MKTSYNYDYKKFIGAISSNTEAQIESQLMFAAHSIEKGLSHENFRPNFGENALLKLSKALETFNSYGFSKSNIRYKIALSSLKNYKKYHEEQEIEPVHLNHIFSVDILNEVKLSDEHLSGTIFLEKEDKKDSKKKNFYEISQERTSIREFSDVEVDMKSIESAINISMKTPTVCNRQPNRVYIIKNKQVMETILNIQGGYKGYKLPAILLLVSTDNRAFVSVNERNEGFIDGGLFSMSLLYALEYEGLGACALNAMMNHTKEQEIKRILNVSEFENLIMFIVVGQIPDEGVKCPKSQRDDYQKIMRVIQ
ncbi:nitroreductase family protein [Enterococcus termitis]